MALLVLRVWAGLLLFFQHGLGKVTHFSQMSGHFPNPIHIGPLPSLLFAILSDAICSLLVVFGVGTRYAALIVVINLATAFTLVHHMKLSGPGNGELPLLFCGIFLALVIAGAGRYSVDGSFLRRR
ncbi:MAG TPA: DoxX family protein [Bryobacteraceae bacterium]|jgi:putative oxidoreductase|nr:DoxX family protein [Bryobacteraceae bacterium]